MTARLSLDQVRHGTYAGYSWHQTWSMPACDACRLALREYGRKRSGYRPKPAEWRFLQKVLIGDGCWPWQGFVAPDGYARFRGGSEMLAHRFSYRLFVGEIPPDLTIDHLCRNRSCVRPDHLEVVTRAENIRRSHQARRSA